MRDIPKGIWYEKARNRWRVKIAYEGVLLHRSYHRVYEDAFQAWITVKRDIRHNRPLPTPEPSILNRFLCQPRPGASRVKGN